MIEHIHIYKERNGKTLRSGWPRAHCAGILVQKSLDNLTPVGLLAIAHVPLIVCMLRHSTGGTQCW